MLSALLPLGMHDGDRNLGKATFALNHHLLVACKHQWAVWHALISRPFLLPQQSEATPGCYEQRITACSTVKYHH